MSNDKNTPGEWRVRAMWLRWPQVAKGDEHVIDCFVTAPDVNGYAYDAEVLGDDEYHEQSGGIERKLADCQLIAAAPVMREAIRWIRDELGKLPVRGADDPGIARMREAVELALRKLDEVPRDR